MGDITIVGLGPGPLGFITLEAWDKISGDGFLLLRTQKHPAAAALKERGISFSSCDAFYEEQATFDEVYDAIVTKVLTLAKEGKRVVYAVPGSPLVAEKTVTLLRRRAAKEGISAAVLAGMSFMELLYVRLEIDPIEGLTIIDGADLEALPPDAPTALVVTQVYNRRVASEVKLSLMELYPDDYMVTLVQNLGLPDEAILRTPLYELDRLDGINHLTSVFVPRPERRDARFALDPLTQVMARLRSPGGCVWDIEQTHASLRRNLIEEVYEVIEAIDLEDAPLLCEELGDLLLQVVFHARMAEEAGHFSLQDVIDGITEKLIRRHPHVFGDTTVRDAGEVVLNWDKIKQKEKAAQRRCVLDGVPMELPSLMKAQKLQHKAAKVGFDWDNISFVWDKIKEEIAELQEAVKAGNPKAVEEELGDCLFSFVNLARFIDQDAEIALNRTNEKFKRRFSHVEDSLRRQKKEWGKVTLAELDALWEDAKTLGM